jgi:hypothetical protein
MVDRLNLKENMSQNIRNLLTPNISYLKKKKTNLPRCSLAEEFPQNFFSVIYLFVLFGTAQKEKSKLFSSGWLKFFWHSIRCKVRISLGANNYLRPTCPILVEDVFYMSPKFTQEVNTQNNPALKGFIIKNHSI